MIGFFDHELPFAEMGEWYATMQRADHNDVEKLSRGQATRAKIGSRGKGHRLTQKERILFDAAKRAGFLKIPLAGIRQNVIRIYQLWCGVEGRECIVIHAAAQTPESHQQTSA